MVVLWEWLVGWYSSRKDHHVQMTPAGFEPAHCRHSVLYLTCFSMPWEMPFLPSIRFTVKLRSLVDMLPV